MKFLAALVALPFLGLGALMLALTTIFSVPSQSVNGQDCPVLSTFDVSSASPSAADQPGAQQQAAGSAAQQQNLKTIIGQVKAYGLPEPAAVDAITAGLAESGLNNDENFVNADSVGVFQERPSTGWGAPQKIMDLNFATDEWLQHLEAISGWQSMTPQAVAQAVERSADPQRYAQFVQQATTWVDEVWASVPAATAELSPSGAAPGGSASSTSGSAASGSATSASSCLTLAGLSVTSTLTALQEGGLWPVVLPVPAPGWVQQIGLPRWPASLVASPPTAVSNQCVAGAEWAYDLLHHSTYRFPAANGVDVARAAAAHGLQASGVPQVGDVVSFSIAGSAAGHVALVIATSPNAFEVVEQNFLQDNPFESQWSLTDWDIRSVAWPNTSVTGIAGP